MGRDSAALPPIWTVPLMFLIVEHLPQVDAQVWSALKAKLASLHELQAKVTETTLLVNSLQQHWNEFEGSLTHTDDEQVDDEKDDDKKAVREKLLEALGTLQDQSEQETASVSQMLMAVY